MTISAHRKRSLVFSLILPTLVPAAAARAQSVNEVEELSLGKLLDVVVSATLREQSTLDAPASVTVVTADQIRARGYRNLKQVVIDVVGFNDVQDVNEEIVASRGVYASTTNKLLILINGHRMNDVLLGRYNLDQYLGMEAVERIEFIRGAASALYGTGALVGVINIVTKKGADIGGTRVSAQAGVHAQEASVTHGSSFGEYDALFNFTWLNAKGTTLDQGAELEPTNTPMGPRAGEIYLQRYPQNLSALLQLKSERQSITFRGAHFRRVTPRGGSGHFYNYENEALKPTYTENDFFVDYSYNWTWGKNKLTFNPSYHFFNYIEHSFMTLDSARQPPLGSRSGKVAESSHYQLKLTYDRQILDNLNLIVGADSMLASMFRTDSVGIAGPNVLLGPSGYSNAGNWFLAGGFVQAVYSPLEQLTLTVGGRYDTFQKEADPKFTPRAGIVYKPLDELAVKLLFGQSYLAPQWAHKRAANIDFQGNPDLDPETYTGGNLIVAYATPKATASVDLHYNQVDGLINSVRNPNNTFSYLNTGELTYMGVDVSADYEAIERYLRVGGSYSYIRADTDNTNVRAGLPPLLIGDEIKDIPSHTVRYGVRSEPLPNLTLSVWGRWYGPTQTKDYALSNDKVRANPDMPMQTIGTNDYEVPSVFLVDASVMYTWNKITAQLIGTNLTDQAYEIPGAVPRPLARAGLQIEAMLGYTF